eukprot:CAMPEP_0183327116 /NCGR_PEP_ID=MMETSP0160_2-20130417/83598_1 /TAXON_ID=2839 ORGANISM="Odontella Sinensis, Strain Grunow 1884" /NCGR_SAMPLE_ID=MMETSP0160_2 /ASSEMBLY_ACC=CAM_ASM_000250 /LENGTH=296 /DNA_ID=CAMNT_0025495229 /DNA_START=115 /DNA_END=1003 /DNA_ORIENTATION=-
MRLLLTSSVLLALLSTGAQQASAFGVVPSSRAASPSSVAFGPVASRCLPPSEPSRRSSSRLVTALAAESSTITMPALSSTMKEGRVVSWLKSEGDAIEAGEAIMVVESDKADMDVEEAPAASAVPDCEFSQIDMPALSSTMKEGKVVSWLKSEGDTIEAGEAIMVVESDKADMDVEAFEDGFIAKIMIAEGESAPVGDVVAYIAAEESEIAEVAAMAEGGGDAAAAAAPAAEEPAAAAEAPAASAVPDCEFSQIDMPALSSTMKEGKVVSWLKSEGDTIEAGEAIMVVESDKADMD